MKTSCPLFLNVFIVCLTFSSCANYATVSERRPVFRPLTGTISAVAKTIKDAVEKTDRQPLAALGLYLSAAKAASDQLALTPDDNVVRDEYNFAVARIFSIIREKNLDPWSKPLAVPGKSGTLILTNRTDPRKKWDPALYEFVPADRFDVGGVYINEHETKEGLGAALVAIGREINQDAKQEFSLPRTYYGVTAVAHFSGNRCEISIEDPLATETVDLGTHRFPLAADFTVPIAVMLASSDPKQMGLSRLLNPEKYADTASIARLQPFDPDKTVVLVVHGLSSSPATWAPMINHLRSDDEFRRNYQVWLYSYPSGYPFMHSAAILRKELDAIEKKFPLRKKMVVIGHSMGGCISRLLITDVGDKLWFDYFGKPPAQVKMSEESKKLVSDAIIFNERPEIGRVIFISAPLRGADMAAGWIGKLGAKLVKSPLTLLRLGDELLQSVRLQPGTATLNRIPNSVDTLSPNNRFVKAINNFPLSTTIPYHSIVGDRGKGGNKDHTEPVRSDGLVPYWSSHLADAKSELVVPSGHNAHQNPQAIAEVKRILKESSR